MVFVGLQLPEPINAAKNPKLIDKGSISEYRLEDEEGIGFYSIIYWKTYQYNKNKIVMKIVEKERYGNEAKEKIVEQKKITLCKVSSKKLKYIKETCYKYGDGTGYVYKRTTDYWRFSSTVNEYYQKGIKQNINLLYYI